jgi:hypothetical protein
MASHILREHNSITGVRSSDVKGDTKSAIGNDIPIGMKAWRGLVLFSDMVLELRVGQKGGWLPRIKSGQYIGGEMRYHESNKDEVRTYILPHTFHTHLSDHRR